MSGFLFINNDMDFRVKGFRDSRAAAGVYLNAAASGGTATWELRTLPDGGGTQVATGAMAYVTASNGEYVGGVDDAVALVVGTVYWLRVILVEGGVKGEWQDSLTGARRTGKNPRG